MLKKTYKYKQAFTLSEVLITLAIVGTIAALTIPAFVSSSEVSKTKAQLKEAFAILDQVTDRMVYKNYGDITGVFGNGDSDGLKNAYLESLNYSKQCNNSNVFGNCWSASSIQNLSGASYNVNHHSATGVVLNNGMHVLIWLSSYTCQDGTWGGGAYKVCGDMHVDLNGFNGPNKLGKDVFRFHLTKNKLTPFGIPDDHTSNWSQCDLNANPTSDGLGCTSYYLFNK